MSLEISDEIIQSSGMSKEELAQEIAIIFFKKIDLPWPRRQNWPE